MDLTPEERQRIYAEEKARIEARDRIKAEQDHKFGSGCFPVVVVLIVVLIGLGIVGSVMDNKPGLGPTLTTGQTGLVVCDDTSRETGLAVTSADYDAMVDAAVAHDTYGFAELLLMKKIYMIPCGTKVLVLDMGFHLDKVRIVDGEYAGLAGWILHGTAR